ncbi:glycoside hydrolase domain-containing protein [Actinoplanes nipponensis]|uniref:glycoside hydrolase domain-containing protein n=1 Tax=Actinoplanes nipponensis TaxID=135950 RepID=UPI0031E8C080
MYFGGNNRGCAQPELTADWVTEQQAAGWHLVPLYVGPQASCTTSNKKNLIDNTQAAAQGRAAADDAVTQATALGLAPESALIYDMEAYRTDDATCRTACCPS